MWPRAKLFGPGFGLGLGLVVSGLVLGFMQVSKQVSKYFFYLHISNVHVAREMNREIKAQVQKYRTRKGLQ